MSRRISPPPRNYDDDQPLLPGLDDFASGQHRRAWGEEGPDDLDFVGAEWPVDRSQW